ncbi:hypothetical protein [Zooshikella sp. RANM57]|uniref:hypothetical protein n=1 Tax=Zooshikella sp. RANM57 TaxID=3425863 RepID=UPI003D6E917E
MIVPKYWSESKITKNVNGKQVTIKRFGWSDISEAEANEHAKERVKDAEKLLDTKGDVRRIDHKVAYNGAEGLPIREEVISTHRDNVITRNSYGSLCINTPNVFFSDIDIDNTPTFSFNFISTVILLSLTIFIGIISSS